jgi:hypothetical protein
MTLVPQEFPIDGEPVGLASTTGRWDGGRHYVAICEPCGWHSRKLSRPQARAAMDEHVTTRAHWMLRTAVKRTKRLTANHWAELFEADRYDPWLRFGNGEPDYDRLDRQAEAAGYDRNQGAFRPWYRRRVMGLVALTGDEDAFATINRLNEIADAQREVGDLTIALREWMEMTELIATVRGDA